MSESTERDARRKKPRYNPHMVVHNDLKYKEGKKICSSCDKEKPLHEFLIAKHQNGGHLYRMSRCRACSNLRMGQVHREYKHDRFRNKCHHYGEPEKTKTGKWYRTEHLEQYLRQSWNPYITIPDHAGRWYEPVAVYPDEIPGTGEVFGCAA